MDKQRDKLHLALALAEHVEIELASVDVVVVVAQALRELLVLVAAHTHIHRVARHGTGLHGAGGGQVHGLLVRRLDILVLVNDGAGTGNSVDGTMSNSATSTESHTLHDSGSKAAHQATTRRGGRLLRGSHGLGSGLSRDRGRLRHGLGSSASGSRGGRGRRAALRTAEQATAGGAARRTRRATTRHCCL